MCYIKHDVCEEAEKYLECFLIFEKMIKERTRIRLKMDETLDEKMVQKEVIIIQGKKYCKVNNELFYCACFQTIGLSNIKEIESPCTVICFSCTNQARKYALQHNISILLSITIHLFSMNPSLPRLHLCTKREQNEYIKRYGKMKYTPKILHDDPYIQYIGAKKGDLLRIYRKQNDCTYIYYRYVM